MIKNLILKSMERGLRIKNSAESVVISAKYSDRFSQGIVSSAWI